MWGVEFFGILRCAQNDSKNLQHNSKKQRQVQKQERSVGEERIEAEKRISPLRDSRWDRESLRSK
jgi:hypothetical protein